MMLLLGEKIWQVTLPFQDHEASGNNNINIRICSHRHTSQSCLVAGCIGQLLTPLKYAELVALRLPLAHECLKVNLVNIWHVECAEH